VVVDRSLADARLLRYVASLPLALLADDQARAWYEVHRP
jgi:hypothetical protein